MRFFVVGAVIVLRGFLGSFLTLTPLRLPRLVGRRHVRRPICRSNCILLSFGLRGPYPLRRIVGLFRSRVRLIVLCRGIASMRARFKRFYYTFSGPGFKQVCGVGTDASTGKGIRSIVIAVCRSLRFVCNSLYRSVRLRTEANFFGCGHSGTSVLVYFV